MNKADLIDDVAKKASLSKKESRLAVDAVISSITAKLSKKEKVQIIGFGSFETRTRASRKGRNPQTGEEITIPETNVHSFHAGKSLKEAVK